MDYEGYSYDSRAELVLGGDGTSTTISDSQPIIQQQQNVVGRDGMSTTKNSSCSDVELVNSLLQKYYFNNSSSSTTSNIPAGILVQPTNNAHNITTSPGQPTTTTKNMNTMNASSSVYYIEDDGMLMYDGMCESNTAGLVGCERIASITCSILEKLKYDSVTSMMSLDDLHSYNNFTYNVTTDNKTATTSTTFHSIVSSGDTLEDSDLDILCSNVPLFSPSSVAEENPSNTTLINFSTDSLDNNNHFYAAAPPPSNLYTLTFQDNSTSASFIENNIPTRLYDIARSTSILLTNSTTSSGNNNKHSNTISVQTSSADESTTTKQPLYVCYPNYTLPDLKFLNNSESTGEQTASNYKLVAYGRPQHQRPLSSPSTAPHDLRMATRRIKGHRPLSSNDVDVVRARLSEMPDPDSLAILLPKEYTQYFYKDNKINSDNRTNTTQIQSSSSQSDVSNKLLQQLRRRRRRGRFSLQELPEILEITTEIEKNLNTYEKYTEKDNTKGTIPPQNSPYTSSTNNNIKRKHHQNNQWMKDHENYTTINIGSTSSSTSTQMMIEKRGMTSELELIVSRVYDLCCNNNSDKYSTDSNRRRSSGSSLSSYGTKSSGSTPPPLVVNSSSPGGEGVLRLLCPALYSLLSDGLSTHIDTLFGRIPNSVWRLVEASIQYGPSSQALSELVMRINSEDLLAEGPMKFNSFISGLLNLGCLGVWMKYMRAKDRLLRSHYSSDSYLYNSNTLTRSCFDQLLLSVSKLSEVRFNLDLFHELKEMQLEFKELQSKTTGNRILSKSKDSKVKLNSKTSKYLSNQYKKSQMKRSVSDERPNKIDNSSNVGMPKSKTAINISNQKINYLIKKNSVVLRQENIISSEKGSAESKLSTKNQQPRPKSLDYNTRQTYLTQNPVVLHSAAGKNEKPQKFKQLQLQWESLTSTAGGNNAETTTATAQQPSTAAAASSSRIPRPISMTSPTMTPLTYTISHSHGNKKQQR